MPIKIPDQLPATEVLREENIFFMQESRATTQAIRPLKVIILNLMPKKRLRQKLNFYAYYLIAHYKWM